MRHNIKVVGLYNVHARTQYNQRRSAFTVVQMPTTQQQMQKASPLLLIKIQQTRQGLNYSVHRCGVRLSVSKIGR